MFLLSDLSSLRWCCTEVQSALQDKAYSWHWQIQTLGESARGELQADVVGKHDKKEGTKGILESAFFVLLKPHL